MTSKELFIETYNKNIRRPGAEKAAGVDGKHGLFHRPASTRFHAAYEGGLLTTSLNVYNVLISKHYDPATMISSFTIASRCCMICAGGLLTRPSCATARTTAASGKVPVYAIDDQFPMDTARNRCTLIESASCA